MSQTSVNFGSECRKFCISILLNLRLARPPGSTEWPPCPRRSLGAGRRASGGGRLPETNRAPAIRDCGSRLAAVAHIGRVPQSCGWKRRGRRRIHRECAPRTGPQLFLVVFTWLILTVRAQPNSEKVIPLRDLICTESWGCERR
jgi:hypothetical protein